MVVKCFASFRLVHSLESYYTFCTHCFFFFKFFVDWVVGLTANRWIPFESNWNGSVYWMDGRNCWVSTFLLFVRCYVLIMKIGYEMWLKGIALWNCELRMEYISVTNESHVLQSKNHKNIGDEVIWWRPQIIFWTRDVSKRNHM